jgi:Flp pilus assembly protein TadB
MAGQKRDHEAGHSEIPRKEELPDMEKNDRAVRPPRRVGGWLSPWLIAASCAAVVVVLAALALTQGPQVAAAIGAGVLLASLVFLLLAGFFARRRLLERVDEDWPLA